MISSFVSTTAIGLGAPVLAQSAPADQPPSVASPEDQPGGQLEEIVVTAQKRAQNLQQVGIAITALSGEAIASSNIATSADLAGRVVGLESYSPYGPGTSANVVIRGVGLNDFGEGHEAPVTTYVDEFYLVSVPAVDFALFDLDRAEVLRGPQGTLFGRNSTGGLINYVTAKPGSTSAGYVSASFGSFRDLKVEAAATIPLGDHFSLRISGLSRHSDGYQQPINPAFERGGKAGTDAVRAQLRYRGNDGLDILLKGEYGRTSTVHSYYETITGYVDSASGLVIADPTIVDAAGYAERNSAAAAPNVVSNNDQAYLRSEGFTALLRIEKPVGNTTLTSITGYQTYSREMREDSDGTPNPLVIASFPYQSKVVTQEFRAFHKGSSLRWTIGAFGMHSVGKDQPNAVFNFPLDPATTIDPATGLYNGAYLPFALNADWRLRTNSIAAFVQLEKDFGPFTLIGGLRYTYDSKTFQDADNAAFRSCSDGSPDSCFLVSEGGTGTPRPFALSYGQNLVSGKLEIDYKPNDSTLLYFSFSRGTKAGGFNNGFYPSGITLAQIPYGAETLHAYEIGKKLTLFDRRVRFNTSAFYYDYRNYQAFNYVGVAGLVTNQNAVAYGVESEIEAAITPRLKVQLSAAYLHTRIDDVAKATPSGTTVVADRPMAFAPKWSASGSVTYKVPLSGNAELDLNWNFDSRTSRFAGNFGDPGTELNGYFRHNASVTYKAGNGFEARMFVDNIGNRHNLVYAGPSFASLGIIQVRYAMPRTVGVAASFHW
ncbi:MAG: TonB-dependent receptor [Novosphingobium sp.]